MPVDLYSGAETDELRELRKIRETIRRSAIRQDLLIPRPVDFFASGTTPASGNFMLISNPAGPPSGYLWHVRYLIFTGSAGALTSPAGTGHVYVGAQPTRDAADVSGSWRDKTREAFPTSATYGRFELVVTYPEVIYALVVNGAASTGYTFAGMVEQVVDTAEGVETYNLG